MIIVDRFKSVPLFMESDSPVAMLLAPTQRRTQIWTFTSRSDVRKNIIEILFEILKLFGHR